ncbi:hypothetical protein ACP4OV_014931 [Aristida adscensionis]
MTLKPKPPPPPPLQHESRGHPLVLNPLCPMQPTEEGANDRVVESDHTTTAFHSHRSPYQGHRGEDNHGEGEDSSYDSVQLSQGSLSGDTVPAVKRRGSPLARPCEADSRLLRVNGVAGCSIIQEDPSPVGGGGAPMVDGRIYACPLCSSTFTRETVMHGHMRMHERDPSDESPSPKRLRKRPRPATKKAAEAYDGGEPPLVPTLSWGATARRGRIPNPATYREDPPAPEAEETIHDMNGMEIADMVRSGKAASKLAAPVNGDDDDGNNSMDVTDGDDNDAEANNAVAGARALASSASAPAATQATAPAPPAVVPRSAPSVAVAVAAGTDVAGAVASSHAATSNGKAIAIGGETKLRAGHTYDCKKCGKTFACVQALGGHAAGHRSREKKSREMRAQMRHPRRLPVAAGDAGGSSSMSRHGRRQPKPEEPQVPASPYCVLALPAPKQVVEVEPEEEEEAAAGNGAAGLVPAAAAIAGSSSPATRSTISPQVPLQNEPENPPEAEGMAMEPGNGARTRTTIRLFGVDIIVAECAAEEPKE